MKLLVTGGAGFVGSSMSILLKQKYPDYSVTVLDNLKRRGSELNLPRLKNAGVEFVHGDIRNKEDFNSLPAMDALIEASAEPSVLAGLDGAPDYLINTNLLGTINCLNFASKSKADFLFLSTSRVYPIKTIETLNFQEEATRFSLTENQPVAGVGPLGIAETFPLDGARSLYGATKLASELLIHEYNEFYGLRTVINRCGVITGPWQMGKVDQGVMVLWVAKHFFNQSLGYFGYGGAGKQTRDMLHADDLFDLIDWQLHHMDKVNGLVLNAGGGLASSTSLVELTRICQEVTGNTIPIKSVPETRTADIRLYVTDNSKVTKLTGWVPKKGINDIVADVAAWLRENEGALAPILR